MNKIIRKNAIEESVKRLHVGRWSMLFFTLSTFILLLSSCSLTSHLPQGEVLYTGVSSITQHRVDTIDEAVNTVIATNLEVAPNSAFFGSAYHMSPLPIGLWLYNGLYTSQDHGLRHWLWSHFKSDPTLLSQVNPRLRAQAAEAALRDEGYFDASVTYDTVFDADDSLKAKISYDIDYHHHSRLGSVTFMTSPYARIDSIIRHTLNGCKLYPGERFSVANLEAEQTRLTNVLKDSGYFFFSPEYIKFMGDSTQSPNTVNLRILVGVGADQKAVSPCTIDSVHYTLDYGAGLRSHNFDTLRWVTVGYNGPLAIKTRFLRRALGFRQHALYTPDRITLCKTLISRLNTFKYTTTEFQILHQAGDSLPDMWSPADQRLDTTRMRLNISATYNYPWSGNTEIGCVYKDNQQVGPGVTLSATKRNVFGGGEKLTFQLDGSYEWRTGNKSADQGSLVNSYEFGTKASLAVPRLQIPRFFRPNRENPVSSTYSMSLDWMRRAGLFEMIKAGASIEYGFSINKTNTFTVTPIKFTYVSLARKSDNFEQLISRYPSLEHSFENQFIPQIQLAWTYDNSALTQSAASSQYVNVTLAEAGGISDLLTAHIGSVSQQGSRHLFSQPFSQFVKATAECRNTYRISDKLTLASRLLSGIGYAYGNSEDMPYSEQFYIGGPNSLRGFSVRGVGPGCSMDFTSGNKYAYLNRVGDFKLEANAELRFPLAGSLYGAIFADAGNIWRLHKDLELDGSDLSSSFMRALALDSGLGFRLDMGMLVLRLDIGAPLHDPNASDAHYFNCRHGFLSNLGYNLAVGYPF